MRESVRKQLEKPYNLDLCRDLSFMTLEEVEEYINELKRNIAISRTK